MLYPTELHDALNPFEIVGGVVAESDSPSLTVQLDLKPFTGVQTFRRADVHGKDVQRLH